MPRKELALIFISLIVLRPSVAQAEEIGKPEWLSELSAEVAFESKYIWRGQNLADDSVAQPSASVKVRDFTFSMWGNYDTGKLGRFTEWDYILDHGFNIGQLRERLGGSEGPKFIDALSITNGYIYYTFPHLSGEDEDSQEYYLSLSYDILLKPYLGYYYDWDSGHGSYWEFGISHKFEFRGISAGLGAVCGYNAGQWGYDNSFSSLLFSGELGIPVYKHFTISPNLNYSLALDEQYNSGLYGGVKIGMSF